MSDFPDDDGRVHIPSSAIDRWDLDLDEDTLKSGAFEIRQKDGKKPTAILRTGTYSSVELGEHRSIRSAIKACRDVAMAVRRAHESDKRVEPDPDPEPDPDLSASYSEKYETELLNRRRKF